MDLCSSIVKYNSQTLGRDKFCRTLQYSSKLVGHLLTNSGNADWAGRVKNLEVHVSTSRKLFRLFKSLDHILGLIKTAQIEDNVLQVLTSCTRIIRIVYFLIDQVTWASRLGLYKANPKEWSKFQAKFWLAAILFCLLRNIYDLYNLLKTDYLKKTEETIANDKRSVPDKLSERPAVIVDTVKNCADFLIPLNIMGIISINNGIVGVLGMISSLAGASTVWRPDWKLKPT